MYTLPGQSTFSSDVIIGADVDVGVFVSTGDVEDDLSLYPQGHQLFIPDRDEFESQESGDARMAGVAAREVMEQAIPYARLLQGAVHDEVPVVARAVAPPVSVGVAGRDFYAEQWVRAARFRPGTRGRDLPMAGFLLGARMIPPHQEQVVNGAGIIVQPRGGVWGVEWTYSGPALDPELLICREQFVTCQSCTGQNKVMDPAEHKYCVHCGTRLPQTGGNGHNSIEREHLAVAFTQLVGVERVSDESKRAHLYREIFLKAQEIAKDYAVTVKYLNGGKLMLVGGLGSDEDDAERNLIVVRHVLNELQAFLTNLEKESRFADEVRQLGHGVVAVSSMDVGAGYKDDYDLFGVPVNRAQRQLAATMERRSELGLDSDHVVVVTDAVAAELSEYYGGPVVARDVAYAGFGDASHTITALHRTLRSAVPTLASPEEIRVANPQCERNHQSLGDKHCPSCGSAYFDPAKAHLGKPERRVVLAVDMSGFTSLFAELGPKGVSDRVRAFVSAIEFEFAKEGGSIKDFIHRAGDEVAISIAPHHFAKMLRAMMRVFRRLERRYPEIKIKAAFAAGELMEYPDGIKIGSVVGLAQATQDSAPLIEGSDRIKHGIVIHSSIPRSEFERAVETDGVVVSGGTNHRVTGLKKGLGFLTRERFTPKQRRVDGAAMYEFYQKHTSGDSPQLGLYVYQGSRDSGKAMGIGDFLGRLDLDRNRVLRGAAFPYQRDPIRNALMHHVASFDYDEITADGMRAFWEELNFFEEEFVNNFGNPEQVVREVFADYLGVRFGEASHEVRNLRRGSAAKFLELTHRIVAHVVRRLLSHDRPAVLVLFNIDFVRADRDARQLLARIVETNKDKPGMILAVSDSAEAPESAEEYWRSLLGDEITGLEERVGASFAEHLDEAAIRMAIADIYDHEISMTEEERERSGLDSLRFAAYQRTSPDQVPANVVAYYHEVSRGNIQVLRAFLHYDMDSSVGWLGVEASSGNLQFLKGEPPKRRDASQVNAMLLAPLDRLSPFAREIFDTIVFLSRFDDTFYGKDLPQHTEKNRTAVALALAELREEGFIANEGKGQFRVVRTNMSGVIRSQVRRSGQLGERHYNIVQHLSGKPVEDAWGYALLGYHLHHSVSYHRTRSGIGPKEVQAMEQQAYQEAMEQYRQAVSMAYARLRFQEALEYLNAMERTANQIEGVEGLRRREEVLLRRIQILKDNPWNLKNGIETDPWYQAIQAYAALTEDASFGDLSAREQEIIQLQGGVIFMGEFYIRRQQASVIPLYNRFKRERAEFIQGLSDRGSAYFNLRAMGAYQMGLTPEDRRMANHHFDVAVRAIMGAEEPDLSDVDRFFSFYLFREDPQLFARACLNVASRLAMFSGEYALAIPYAERAVALNDALRQDPGASAEQSQSSVADYYYSNITLAIALIGLSRFDEAIAILQRVHDESSAAGTPPFAIYFSLHNLGMALLKRGDFIGARQRFEQVLESDFEYPALMQEEWGHLALMLAFDHPEDVSYFVSEHLLEGRDISSIASDQPGESVNRAAHIYLALFFAEVRLGNHTAANAYLVRCLREREALGHVEDMDAEIKWLGDHQAFVEDFVAGESFEEPDWEDAPTLIQIFFESLRPVPVEDRAEGLV